MNFLVNKNEFARCINTVSSVITTKEISALIGNVLLEAKDGSVSLTATDTEKTIRNRIPANVVEEGSILLQGKKLAELVKEFRYNTMRFSLDDHKVIIQNGDADASRPYSTKVEMIGAPADEFPVSFDIKDLKFTTLNSKTLLEMINKVSYASAVDDARIVFNGILVEYRDDLLHLVATDGRRLALVKRPESDFLEGNKIIIPSRSIREIKRLLSESESVEVAYSSINNELYIKAGDIYFSTKLIEGNFPDYNMVIPKEHQYRVELHCKEFMESIRQAMVFAQQPNKQVQLHFRENLLLVVSKTPELGKIEDGIACSYTGEAMVIGFNSDYLLDMLGAISSDKVIMAFKNPDAPAVFYDTNDSDFLCIVMPMRIQE